MTNRQEVAEKLREAGEDIDGVRPSPSIAFAKIDTTIGTNNPRYVQGFYNRLADLIDPTCKPYITCESLTESITKYTAECSNCGAIFGDFQTIEQAKTTHPVYCPSCGARVVRDEA